MILAPLQRGELYRNLKTRSLYRYLDRRRAAAPLKEGSEVLIGVEGYHPFRALVADDVMKGQMYVIYLDEEDFGFICPACLFREKFEAA
ncbi:hypothetical protein [Deinococcus sp. S9]|uniref:hypothetical protein n=1 Tax=Deinococcus sp. S9 TaxID=2545754 RepID=UPI001056CE86|nr:hypothetical protein [Deinococcus sp. S9]TDE87391.1 hypothetical protein E0686_02545 [Deinococcus sp. S9]